MTFFPGRIKDSMRGLYAWIGLALCSIALCDTVVTVLQAQSTSEIFSRLDQASPSFRAATANIRVVTHTGVIDKDDVQIGSVIIKRYSSNELRFLITFTGEDAQAISFRGPTVQIYYPKLNTVREYDIGKYKDVAQKLILLGFGMSGRQIAANYNVRNLGGEMVESQNSVHLQLTPLTSDVLKQLSRVDLWISLKTNCPVQQKFYMPGGDYRLVTYSDVKLNPHMPASALDLPKSAKRERMN